MLYLTHVGRAFSRRQRDGCYFQLASNTKKLFDFCESIQAAPEDIRKVKSDLDS